MEAQIGTPPPSVATCNVLSRLKEQSGSFDFFQAMRLIHLVSGNADPITFRVNSGLAFPPSQIQSISETTDGGIEAAVAFLGLIGPGGILPYFYSELVSERYRSKDTALGSFFDIFHHRLLSQFYQAWEKNRFPVRWERDEPDAITSALLAYLGLGTPNLAQRQDISDQVLLYYAGLLAMNSRPACSLEQMLADYFELPVTVEQFVGDWFLLPEANRCRLGNEGRAEELGVGTILGDSIWSNESRIRIRIGPMRLKRYCDFLPGAPGFIEAKALVDFFSNCELDFELQPVLKAPEVPVFELGENLPLGWCSWLRTEDFDHDPADVVVPLGEQLCM